ncbi:unnamed protein product [Withania somnifera]
MEVEVKLRLPDSAAHQKVISLLSPYHTKIHHQRNTFFDGNPEQNVKCTVCLKGNAVIIDGVSRVEEDEGELDSKLGYECVENPRKLMEVVDSKVLKRAKEEFQVGKEGGFIGLGGFKNVRNVFEWNGVVLEVDETMYDFGTCYEIECESSEPEKVKGMIETLLKENGVDYSYSQVSKFATFRSGKLP